MDRPRHQETHGRKNEAPQISPHPKGNLTPQPTSLDFKLILTFTGINGMTMTHTGCSDLGLKWTKSSITIGETPLILPDQKRTQIVIKTQVGQRVNHVGKNIHRCSSATSTDTLIAPLSIPGNGTHFDVHHIFTL